MTPTRLLPEHHNGWTTEFDIEGVAYEICAQHYTRRRVPKPHEMARQYMRGLPVEMVAETDYEWAVFRRIPLRRVCSVKQVPAGFIFMGGQDVHRSLVNAAKAGIARMAV